MKKIKVLQVIGGLNMGGAETFIINVFRNINREKYEFTLPFDIAINSNYDIDTVKVDTSNNTSDNTIIATVCLFHIYCTLLIAL